MYSSVYSSNLCSVLVCCVVQNVVLVCSFRALTAEIGVVP